MGTPLSSLVAELFLQYFELHTVKHSLETKSIIFYTRYVDDILSLYVESLTNVSTLTGTLNKINSNLIFTPFHEVEGQVSFLNLWIIRNNSSLEIDIFSKPTTTNTTIHHLSNHPTEHKMEAYQFLIRRMNSLPLKDSRKQKECKTIKYIAAANGFPLQLISSVKTRLKREEETPRHPTDPHRKRITLTYFGPYIRSISNLFKQVNLQVTYKTTNRIAKLLRTQPRHNKNDYENSGTYSLRCATCHLTYVGQTDRNMKTRYSEHARYIRSNNPQSAYAQHILQ
jgi:hypothetical protein